MVNTGLVRARLRLFVKFRGYLPPNKVTIKQEIMWNKLTLKENRF